MTSEGAQFILSSDPESTISTQFFFTSHPRLLHITDLKLFLVDLGGSIRHRSAKLGGSRLPHSPTRCEQFVRKGVAGL